MKQQRFFDRPVVGVPACVKFLPPHPYFAVGEKYVRAVADGAGALPFMLPPLGDWYDWDDLLGRLDGLFITGSPSNVEPARYGGPASREGTPHDPARDATNLPLIRAAIDAGVPLLAVCRGIQELNVAYGGSLHQHVQEVPGRFDHREDKSAPVEAQYGPAHEVELSPDGLLAALFETTRITVNSIHSQGVDRLGDRLVVEARSDDGQIEAVRVDGAAALALGVQWHPEWQFADNPESAKMFAAFGDACRARRLEALRESVA
jgi:putative glutamine amidotransferase